MTSTSTLSTSLQIRYKYDVFLSFRGEDTRNSFTAHLYDALRQTGITSFRDDDEIREGEELKPEIERCIRESRASIVVFSENFASSRWCLDELSLILEQKKKADHFVLPVFYGVDPSDVRIQRGSYMIEATNDNGVKVSKWRLLNVNYWTQGGSIRIEDKEGSKWTEDNVKRWKIALSEAANLKGMCVSGYEPDFIANIVHKIYGELGLKLTQGIPTGLTGIKTRAQCINSWLRCKHLPTCSPVLAICGMGGSGKTTLAKHIYYSNKHNFDGCSFLQDIHKHSDGLLGVQKQLLRDISRNKSIMISNVHEGAIQLRNAIHMNKVLIVVDDIDDIDKLSTLFGRREVLFATQSKIIITTRILNLDTWYESICCRCDVYRIALLNDHESLELLSRHAFGSKTPMKGFEKLALKLAQYCGGNPMALQVLGSSVSVGAQGEGYNMIEVWRSRIHLLNSSKGDLDCRIQNVLQKSFESLPYDSHKELFLHTACFFIGKNTSIMEDVLEKDWHAKYGIMTLINRCLLYINSDSSMSMHPLVQDMARKMVCEESKDPAKRSRVWHHDESYCLLKNEQRQLKVLLSICDILRKGIRLEEFNTSSLVKMRNLKFLHLTYVRLIGSYENFPDLRWLSWRHCNIKTITLGLLTSSLVALDMSCGNLEEFKPPTVLNSLKYLDLSMSYKLVSIRKLHRLPKLVRLKVWGCSNLTHVCRTIVDLENLYSLNFAYCSKLLEALFICKGIPEQPVLSLPTSLRWCSLVGSSFEMLPNHVDLKMLQKLDLSRCLSLKSLRCLPSTLKTLHVDWCTSLENITFESTRFTLQEFTYEGCFKLCEIEGLFKLVSIAKLNDTDLGHMQWVKPYHDHTVDLVGDVITKGRTCNVQMLHEYGIRSVFLQGIKDQSMATHEHSRPSVSLSFRVHVHPKKHKIQGLSVTFLYNSSLTEYVHMEPSCAIMIINMTKGLRWVYIPVVFCKAKVHHNDVVWLSCWPIGNFLDAGDEVCLAIFNDKSIIVRECGASLVYMDENEKCERIIKTDLLQPEVIGGDMSLFEVTKGGYYLCRRDFWRSGTYDIWRFLFSDNNMEYREDSQRWRTYHGIDRATQVFNAYQNNHRDNIEFEFGVSFNSESDTDKIEKAVSSIVGVESVSTNKEMGRLVVFGHFDPQEVVMCGSKYEKLVHPLMLKYA